MTPPIDAKYTPDTLRALADYHRGRDDFGDETLAKELDTHVVAWKADREWKRAYDEGEAVGMRSNTTDAENSYPEGSHPYCGWSFGFWGSRNASLRKALEAEVAELALRQQTARAEAAEAKAEKAVSWGSIDAYYDEFLALTLDYQTLDKALRQQTERAEAAFQLLDKAPASAPGAQNAFQWHVARLDWLRDRAASEPPGEVTT